MRDENIVMLIVLPALFVTCSFVLWTIFSTIRRYKIARLQADIQAKLVDKFGTTQDLIAYAGTETGKDFLRSLSLEQRSPYDRIIGAVQAGIVSFFFGVALFFLRNRVPGGEQVLLVLGTMFGTLGIGFVLAAAASYSLSKSFGLLNRASAQR
jgi:hypothetical protein